MDGGKAPRGTFVPVGLTTRQPPVGRWLAVTAVALVIVIAKPWSSPERSGGTPEGGATAGAPRNPAPAGTAAVPSTTTSTAGQIVAAFCLDPGTWLIASVERWRDQRIRVWRALEPAVAATGPDDASIPIVPVVSEGLTELGWCAPVVGVEKPGGPVDVAVWRRSSGGATPIVVDTSRPVSDRSPFGELYRPPGLGPSSKATSWLAGTYVFRYHEGDGRERWFAVAVEIRPRALVTP
jgi:hypothetical protein